jgi:hypothetical protein
VLWYTPLRYKTSVVPAGQARQIDIRRLPQVAAAVARFERLRGVRPAAASWWQLPAETVAPTTPHAEAWFAEACAAVGFPAGAFTLYSLRRGGASAALAAGAQLPRIEYLGGWAAGSVVLRKTYLDLSFPNDAGAGLFFGWLALGQVAVVAPRVLYL